MGRESIRGFLQAMYQVSVMISGIVFVVSKMYHDAMREKWKARSLRLYSPDALPQARFEYTLERTRLSGAPPASHVVRSERPHARPLCEMVVVFRANVVFAVTQRFFCTISMEEWLFAPWNRQQGRMPR